jgi:hypothetical protein
MNRSKTETSESHPMQRRTRRMAPPHELLWRIPVALVLSLWLAPACLLGGALACTVGALVWVTHTAVLATRRPCRCGP